MGESESQGVARDGGVAPLTKTAFAAGASKNWRAKGLAAAVLVAAAALGLVGCGKQVPEGADCPAADRARTASGFCVPRWVSLKRGKVYARKGPGADYPAMWVYRAQGLPVQIVAETTDWRRVCDPDGGVAWVHRSMVDGRRMAMAIGSQDIPLARQAGAGSASRPAASPVGLLAPRALARLDGCQGDWCRVSVGGAGGWAPAELIWGVAKTPQCR